MMKQQSGCPGLQSWVARSGLRVAGMRYARGRRSYRVEKGFMG